MGTGVALVTPFNFNGSVDYNSLEKIINSTIDGGVDYLFKLKNKCYNSNIFKNSFSSIILTPNLFALIFFFGPIDLPARI